MGNDSRSDQIKKFKIIEACITRTSEYLAALHNSHNAEKFGKDSQEDCQEEGQYHSSA